jgi:hypothetical protein
MNKAMNGADLAVVRLYPQFSTGDNAATCGDEAGPVPGKSGDKCAKPRYRRAHESHKAAR